MNNFKSEKIDVESEKITISRDEIPFGKLLILTFFTLAGILAPIVATSMLEEGQKQKLLISYIIMWSESVYLIRLILWNLRGKQVLIINSKGLVHYFDYGLFKDRKLELPLNTFQITIDPKGEQKARLVIQHNDRITVSPFELTSKDLILIEDLIKQHLTQYLK